MCLGVWSLKEQGPGEHSGTGVGRTVLGGKLLYALGGSCGSPGTRQGAFVWTPGSLPQSRGPSSSVLSGGLWGLSRSERDWG